MMPTKKSKIKGQIKSITYEVANSREDAEARIHAIGEKRRQLLRIEADMNDAIAKRKQQAEAQASPIKEEIGDLIESVQTWAEANRPELTNNGKSKTITLATGQINWRNRPAKVNVRNIKAVINSLKSLGLLQFIRTKEEINKEALLEDQEVAEQVTGVRIASAGEDFAILPYELDIEKKQ